MNADKRQKLFLLVPIQLVLALLALQHGGFLFRSGTAAGGIVILLLIILERMRLKQTVTGMFALIMALSLSIVGDWFLSHRHGESLRFLYGILFFFLAHAGYLWYALHQGSMRWRATLILLAIYLPFYLLILYPAFTDRRVMIAVLGYLLISVCSLGAALGIGGDQRSRLAFILGIASLLFSDTIIALREFTGYHRFNSLILPTYYLSHIFIACSLLFRQSIADEKESDPSGEMPNE
jgi:hypothetical protein